MVDMPKISVTLVDAFGNPVNVFPLDEKRPGAVRVDLLLRLHEDPRRQSARASSSNAPPQHEDEKPWIVTWDKFHLVHSNTVILPPAMTLQALLEQARGKIFKCSDSEGYDLTLACRKRRKPAALSSTTGTTAAQVSSRIKCFILSLLPVLSISLSSSLLHNTE